MRWLLLQSFTRIGQKIWIFYKWPIFERVSFFLPQTLEMMKCYKYCLFCLLLFLILTFLEKNWHSDQVLPKSQFYWKERAVSKLPTYGKNAHVIIRGGPQNAQAHAYIIGVLRHTIAWDQPWTSWRWTYCSFEKIQNAIFKILSTGYSNGSRTWLFFSFLKYLNKYGC